MLSNETIDFHWKEYLPPKGRVSNKKKMTSTLNLANLLAEAGGIIKDA